MNVVVIVAGIGLCIISLLAYIVISIYAPEWLGMSGKNTKRDNEDLPENNTNRPNDFFSN